MPPPGYMPQPKTDSLNCMPQPKADALLANAQTCVVCGASFASHEYLVSHFQRRHPNQLHLLHSGPQSHRVDRPADPFVPMMDPHCSLGATGGMHGGADNMGAARFGGAYPSMNEPMRDPGRGGAYPSMNEPMRDPGRGGAYPGRGCAEREWSGLSEMDQRGPAGYGGNAGGFGGHGGFDDGGGGRFGQRSGYDDLRRGYGGEANRGGEFGQRVGWSGGECGPYGGHRGELAAEGRYLNKGERKEMGIVSRSDEKRKERRAAMFADDRGTEPGARAAADPYFDPAAIAARAAAAAVTAATADRSNPKLSGIAKRWNAEKGYGFIIPSNGGGNVFCQFAELMEGTELQEGEAVRYELGQDKQGKRCAKRVTRGNNFCCCRKSSRKGEQFSFSTVSTPEGTF